MNIRFLRKEREEVLEYLKQYYKENNIFIDVFWEERVMGSNFYEMRIEDKFAGVCAIFEKSMIMVLAIELEYRHLQYKIFEEVKRLENVQFAAISTSDEIFMGLGLENFKSIEKDSYYSVDSKREIKDLNRLKLRLINIDEIELAIEITEGYYENLETDIRKGEFYFAYFEDEIVGTGHLVPGVLFENQVNIGMYVNSNHRTSGYGTEILVRLKELVYEMNKTPISGCWAYNHYSLKAQIKAGMSMKARFLKFKL